MWKHKGKEMIVISEEYYERNKGTFYGRQTVWVVPDHYEIVEVTSCEWQAG
jgi:hypothetical protein